MTLDEFKATLASTKPPAVAPLLRALWHDPRGEWDEAHRVAQEIDENGAWVHAYLHRRKATSETRGIGTIALASRWRPIR